MATYKVLQDIEAEDKFIGPLTLKQFIFAGIAFVSAYMGFFFLAKHIWFLAVPLLPIMFVAGFLAFPWGRDQPTEIWLLGKMRFMLKPRRRIWDQSGIQELVTITVPKKVETFLSNNLSQIEVKSRLKALANTIDSRGWAVKDSNINLYSQPVPGYISASPDRLIDVSSLPQAVSNIDIQPADDMWDEQNNPVAQHLNQMINDSSKTHRQETLDRIEQIREGKPDPANNSKNNNTSGPPPNYWFMNQPDPSQTPRGYTTFSTQMLTPDMPDYASSPTAEPITPAEKALLKKIHTHAGKPSVAYGHTKVIFPLSDKRKNSKSQKSTLTAPAAGRSAPDPAILALANNDDLNVATIARQANQKRKKEAQPDEVVISLH